MAFSYDNSDPLYVEHTEGSGTVAQRKWEAADVNAVRDFAALTRTEVNAAKARITAAEANILVARPRWDTLPTPWICSHRGVSECYPENTIPAFDAAQSCGAPIECDVQISSDGWPVVIHDTTVDRTTDGTGDVDSLTLAQLKALDASATVPGYPATQIQTLDEFLARYAGRALLMPQPYALGAGIELAQTMSGRPDLLPSVLVQSNSPETLATFQNIAPGLLTGLLGGGGSPPSLANLAAAEAWASLPALADATSEYVSATQAAGYKVIAWAAEKVVEAEEAIAAGVDGVMCDDPAYIRRFLNACTPSGYTLHVPPRLPVPGWTGATSVGGGALAVEGGYATHTQGNIVHLPLRTPDGTWSLTTTLKQLSSTGAAGDYIAVRFAMSRDRMFALWGGGLPVNGYGFLYKLGGGVEIARVTNGVRTTIKTGTWAALSLGSVVPIRIDVTPTSITVTQTTSGSTITVDDATHSRAGFVDAVGSVITDHRVGIGDLTLTY